MRIHIPVWEGKNRTLILRDPQMKKSMDVRSSFALWQTRSTDVQTLVLPLRQTLDLWQLDTGQQKTFKQQQREQDRSEKNLLLALERRKCLS